MGQPNYGYNNMASQLYLKRERSRKGKQKTKRNGKRETFCPISFTPQMPSNCVPVHRSAKSTRYCQLPTVQRLSDSPLGSCFGQTALPNLLEETRRLGPICVTKTHSDYNFIIQEGKVTGGRPRDVDSRGPNER